MKNATRILSLFLVIACLSLFSSCSKADPYKVGDHVAAKWNDGNYWGANITGNTGGKYQVHYDDGSNGEVLVGDLKQISKKEDLKVGDKVFAVWVIGGKMYNGSIQEMQADGAIVKWDDGSTPSFVSFTNIAK